LPVVALASTLDSADVPVLVLVTPRFSAPVTVNVVALVSTNATWLVMAIFLAIVLGGTPLGAPVVGWVADRFGPRWALGVAAASGFAAAVVGIRYLVKYRQLRVFIDAGRVRFSIGDGDAVV